jgi:DNA-binding winged helix-turn-helix (wHTH) protein/Tol biopolymer transport system component
MHEAPVDSESWVHGGANAFAVRFGAFEVCLDTGELRKHGTRVRLQRRPFHILQALLEKPNRVVSREELRARLWSADTFVDFESGLNTAINRLRTALGDSAESPIYIETLARVGYRFIAPVTVPALQQAVEASRAASETIHSPIGGAEKTAPAPRTTAWWWAAGGAVLAASALAAIFWMQRAPRESASFRQLTFSNGLVRNARFAHDGKRVVYSAALNGKGSRLFETSTTGAATKDLGFDAEQLASLSSKDRLALFKGSNEPALEAAPLSGGGASLLANHAMDADWSPDGTLSLVTANEGMYSVEYPPGKTLYASSEWIDDLRVAPQGDRVAFVKHPVPMDDGGDVVVATRDGHSRVLSAGWESIQGLAWRPDEREIWFTAARSGVDRSLMAVDMNGRLRQIAQMPGGMLLRDISASGDVLISRATSRMSMFWGNVDGNSPQDISWLDWSRAVAISSDGKRVLFDETGQGGGSHYSVFLYDADKRSSDRVGDGRAIDLSSDGAWVLTQSASEPRKLFLVSVKDHKAALVPNPGFEYRWAKFFPGQCQDILFAGGLPNQKEQLYRQHAPGGTPVPITGGVRIRGVVVDDSGDFAVGVAQEAKLTVVNLRDGSSRSIGNPAHVVPVAFVGSGQILTRREEGDSVLLEMLNLQNGQVRLYKKLPAGDSFGTAKTFPIFIAKDLKTFTYSRLQTLSTLFVVSGWS